MSAAPTLASHKVTSARVNVPAWGAWYADVAIDGEVSLSGQVDLVIADVTFKGTVLSGGPSTGRSHFRLVGGKGGWGKTIAKKSYANDLTVKLSTVLGDAAKDAGEVLDSSTIDTQARVGANYVRPEDQACRLLEDHAPSAWYVDESGTTKLGKRAASTLPAHVTRTTPIDRAAGKLELASESIAAIVPGVVVDGLEAVDVVHEISAKGGLRSTIYGKVGGETSRRLEAQRLLYEQLDPRRKFRSKWEYRVVTLEGNRANLQPVLVSTGMPDLRRVVMRPGVAGCYGVPALGARVVVGFVNEDPGRPYVEAFEDFDGEGFGAQSINMKAGGQVGGEHVATVEGMALFVYNTLVALMAAAGGGPLLAVVLQPLLGTAVNAALLAQTVPAPVGQVAQAALAATQLAGFATGVTPATTSAFFSTAIGAVETKTPNVSGLFPSAGAAKVKAG